MLVSQWLKLLTTFVVLLFTITATEAAAEDRIALVIGNAAYKQSPLINPVNDARAMATQLRQLGFDVTLRENFKRSEIGSVYREFRTKITPGAIALVFYAGHGLQVRGQNYFPAIDSDIYSEEDVPLNSLNLGSLLENMEEAKAGVSLVFLDACRDNPFARRFRSAARGLAKVEATSGTLIHYATKPGSVASDGDDKNGIYTEALLAQIAQPGIPVEAVLKRVSNQVVTKTKGQQEPWVEGSLRGEFYFAFQGPTTVNLQTPATKTSAPAMAVVIQSEAEIEQELWNRIKGTIHPSVLTEYLKAYPKGRFIAQAKILITQLMTPPAPQPQVKSVPLLAAGQAVGAEDALWSEIQTSNSADEYEVYLSQFPDGKYVALAKLRVKRHQELAAAEKERNEIELWRRAELATDVADVQAYLDAYPNGPHLEAAKKKIDDINTDALVGKWSSPHDGSGWGFEKDGTSVRKYTIKKMTYLLAMKTITCYSIYRFIVKGKTLATTEGRSYGNEDCYSGSASSFTSPWYFSGKGLVIGTDFFQRD
jgi:hypothetical protein